MSDPMTTEKFAVGQSVRRREDPRLIQGDGRYSDDVNLPRQAYAVIVRSPHAHARIRAIDASAALKADGVIAVLTGNELAADGVGNLPTDTTRKRRDGSAAFATPRPALARGRVRHVGDPVALVVADPAWRAADAAEQVIVDYEPLPVVTGAREALRAGAPTVWDEAPDNVAFVWEAGNRDAVARAFEGAAHVTKLDFVVTRVAAAPLEPRAAVGEYDRRTSRYTLHTGTQHPHGTRTLLADQVFRVPQSHLRVVTGEVGGSFGMRSGIYPELVLVLWAAKRLGRPVKWTSSRREGLVTDEAGRDNVSTAELALDADGKFLALRVAIGLNIGAYLTPRSAGPGTNNVGGVAGVYTTPADHAGFKARRDAARARGKLRGLGIANPIEVAGGPYTALNPDTAEVRVNPDGSVTVFTGSTSMGQGNETAFAQIVSDRLGVPPERIQVLWGDSDALSAGRGNGGSGALSVGGSAGSRRAGKGIERGRRIAPHLMGSAHQDVVWRDARFTVAGTDRGVTLAAVARAAYVAKQLPPGLA